MKEKMFEEERGTLNLGSREEVGLRVNLIERFLNSCMHLLETGWAGGSLVSCPCCIVELVDTVFDAPSSDSEETQVHLL